MDRNKIPLRSIIRIEQKYIISDIRKEAIIIFKRSISSFIKKIDIVESFNLLINKKRLTHDDNEVEIANPIMPYLGNKSKANTILIIIDTKLYLNGLFVSPKEQKIGRYIFINTNAGKPKENAIKVLDTIKVFKELNNPC